MVLDALNYIKDHIDGTLSYRWSCRMGVCGSCGMMVNGTPRLTCSALLRDLPAEVSVEPLTNFPIIRDLVVDINDFVHKLSGVKAWLIADAPRPIEDGEYLQSPGQLERFRQFSQCINCLLCYAACPIYGNEPHFVGPAALALAHRYNQDSRDQGWEERAPIVAGPQGVWTCEFVGECSVVCPKHVDPAAAIQRTKLSSSMEWMRNLVMPWANR
jgi:fumarate reductase iron-sulfur subunit